MIRYLRYAGLAVVFAWFFGGGQPGCRRHKRLTKSLRQTLRETLPESRLKKEVVKGA